jgi:hypothetical protein
MNVRIKFWYQNLRERDQYYQECKREGNIKMDVKEMELDIVNWVHITQDMNLRRGCCECGDEPSGPVKCWKIL